MAATLARAALPGRRQPLLAGAQRSDDRGRPDAHRRDFPIATEAGGHPRSHYLSAAAQDAHAGQPSRRPFYPVRWERHQPQLPTPTPFLPQLPSLPFPPHFPPHQLIPTRQRHPSRTNTLSPPHHHHYHRHHRTHDPRPTASDRYFLKFQRIRCPTLLLWGNMDHVIEPRGADVQLKYLEQVRTTTSIDYRTRQNREMPPT